MRAIYSFLFNRITDPLGLPISPVWEFVLLAIISFVAFKIAFSASPGGRLGSEIHWFFRVIAFVVLWAIVYVVIWGGKLIVANWKMILIIAGILLFVGIIACIIACICGAVTEIKHSKDELKSSHERK